MVCSLLDHFFSFFSLYIYIYIFFNLCFLPWQVVQASFRVEETTNYCHRQIKEEEGRCNATVEAFIMAERSIQELKRKLLEKERERKSVTTAFDNAEKQVEGQRILLRNAEDQLAVSRTQINALKKKFKEVEEARELAEKAQDQAKQDRYDLGVAETEKALRAEVSEVCRTYCSQVWNEALNQAKVEASSVLRMAESVYYPLVIRDVSSGSRTDTTSEVIKVSKDSSASVPTSFDKPAEKAEHPKVIEKEKNANQGVAPNAMKPLAVTPDLPVKKEAPKKMEVVLATLPLPAKADPVSKGPKASEAASTQPIHSPPKDKIVIKKK